MASPYDPAGYRRDDEVQNVYVTNNPKYEPWRPPSTWSPAAKRRVYSAQIMFGLVKIVWLLGALVLFGSCAVAAAVGGGS